MDDSTTDKPLPGDEDAQTSRVEAETAPDTQEAAGEVARPRRRRRARRVGIVALVSLVLVAAVLGAAALVLAGRPLTAPDWVAEDPAHHLPPGQSFDAYAVTVLDIAPVLLDWFSSLLRLVLLLPLVLSDRGGAMAAMRGYWPIAFAVGLLAPVSYILVLAALAAGAPLSLVAPAREMSMMVGALLGMLVLRERVGAWRLAGCGLLIAGVVLLSAP